MARWCPLVWLSPGRVCTHGELSQAGAGQKVRDGLEAPLVGSPGLGTEVGAPDYAMTDLSGKVEGGSVCC